MIIFDDLCLVEAAEAIKDWMTEKGLSYKVFNPYNDEEYEIIKRTGFPTEITRNHVNLDSQSGLHIGSYIINPVVCLSKYAHARNKYKEKITVRNAA